MYKDEIEKELSGREIKLSEKEKKMDEKLSKMKRTDWIVKHRKGMPLSLEDCAIICCCSKKRMSYFLKEKYVSDLKKLFNYKPEIQIIPAAVVNYFYFGWIEDK